MKFTSYTSEVIVSLILLIILGLFLSPGSMALMPKTAGSMLTIIFVLIFVVFAGLVWKEKARDEREEFHKLNAGRISFLVGTSVLVLGVVYQSFGHDIDPWLVATLAGMIFAKVAARIYSQLRQ
jgi:Na+/proline symporter